MIKKSWLQSSVLVCFIAAIVLLMILDYFNLESFAIFNNRGFYFDYTWKGRLFLLFFLWLFVLEYSLNLEKEPKKDLESKPRSRLKVIATFICAIIPIIYILSVNFLGFDQAVIKVGEIIRGEYWKANFGDWQHILTAAWPLSIEYLMFTVSFTATILLAYGKGGLKKFGISIGLIAGITAIYLTDTIFPYGVLKPLQLLALPTAACAAALLDLLGYAFALSFSPGLDSIPIIRTQSEGQMVSIGIAWPCAGVHSLFLYMLIILLLFKKSNMSSFRKLLYFIVGAIGTYLVNVLRIITYFFIRINSGLTAAQTFHDTYGELLFVVWVLLYILLIIGIQKFRLAEKTIHGTQTLRNFLERKSNILSRFKSKLNESQSI
ncbi:MAG: archaeosortase/exosortase family protein [Candidatus Bathyarchaeota archaeon]|nr:archaeosortase/exosortase family protein [Candidatus Bathyarchaeota archaeon]